MSPNPWEQLPKEPSDAYDAFAHGLDLPPNRNLTDVYRSYTGNPDATRLPGNWQRMTKKWDWIPRYDAYDRHKLNQASQARKDALKEQYNAELEQFRKAHEQAGKAAFNNVLRLSKAVEEFAITYTGDPQKGIEASRKILTANEGKQVSGIIKDFMGYAPLVWEAALGIPELREQLENAQTEE